MEISKAIPDFPGYAITKKGEVTSCNYEYATPEGRLVRIIEKKLSQMTNRLGYKLVSLRHPDGRWVHRFVHRLVMQTFVGPCPDKLVVCHNDGNPSNNIIENLRYDTHSSNARDKVRHGTHPMSKKTHCRRGHEYCPGNLVKNKIESGRGRVCLSCTRALRYREREKIKGYFVTEEKIQELSDGIYQGLTRT